ncbi:GPI-anchored protein LLG1-like [Salvia divinorum]|uniref:GPI-anchored protein LLG1-like n=1 Tax=Salvia divinorum TaxID=28513 RepID=A0ABD1IDZ1_SALDI
MCNGGWRGSRVAPVRSDQHPPLLWLAEPRRGTGIDGSGAGAGVSRPSRCLLWKVTLCRKIQLLHLAFFLFILAAPLSCSTSISDAVVGYQVGNGRSLLQILKPCPVDIEHQNYTILTSKCKGPDYPADLCCPAYKELACPIVDELSDGSNDCSDKFFSYISTAGQYPPFLFSSICREGKDGLFCSLPPPSSPSNAAAPVALGYPILVVLLFALQFVL